MIKQVFHILEINFNYLTSKLNNKKFINGIVI